MSKVAVVEGCAMCPHFERGLAGYCYKLRRDMYDESAEYPMPDDCPLPGVGLAGDRLYLLWLIEEQTRSALGGHTSQEAALKTILESISESPAEMTGTPDEVLYLSNQGQERVEEMETLISRASRYQTK